MTRELHKITAILIIAIIATFGCSEPQADDHYDAFQIHQNAAADFRERLPTVATCRQHEAETYQLYRNIKDINDNRFRDLESLSQEMANRQIPPDNAPAMEILLHEYYDDLQEEAANLGMHMTRLPRNSFYYCANYNEQHLLEIPCSETLLNTKSIAEQDVLSRHAILGRLKRCIDDGAYSR